MSTKRRWSGWVLFGLWGMPGLALARPVEVRGAERETTEVATPSPEALEKARSAFRSGLEALDAERFDDAVKEFEFALAVKETAGLRYYLGLAHLRAGRFGLARVALGRARELNGEQPKSDVAEVLLEAFAQLEREAPRLRLVGVPTSARVTLDGESVDTGELFIDLGPHHLSIEADGYEPLAATLTLARGERRRVDVAMTPKKTAVTTNVERESSPPSGDGARAVVFWSSVGVAVTGGVVAVVGAVTEAGASARAAEARAAIDAESRGSLGACAEPEGNLVGPCSSLSSALEEQSLGRALLWGGVGGAAVGVVGAVLTHYLWPTADVTPSAEVGFDHFSLRLSGSF